MMIRVTLGMLFVRLLCACALSSVFVSVCSRIFCCPSRELVVLPGSIDGCKYCVERQYIALPFFILSYFQIRFR